MTMTETNSTWKHDNITTTTIPMDDDDRLEYEDWIAEYADWKNEHGKKLAIILSSSAIVSIIASSLLILTIFRSPKRLSTTYHRILLGMSIGDFLFSLSLSDFQALHPSGSDVYYQDADWNARGTRATCNAKGFILMLGSFATLCYSCSLNLYYLASVKNNRTETYIRTKIEPFLHGIPILIALGLLACNVFIVGFPIPCRLESNPFFALGFGGFLLIVPPIVMAVSLGMIYRSVAKQEKRLARYGVGALNPSAQQTSGEGDDAGERANEGNSHQSGSAISIISSIKRKFRRKESSNPHARDRDNSNSRAVKQKALAYTTAYFLSWGWPIIVGIMYVAGVPYPPIAFEYISAFFVPLQGLFNFLVYLHPKVMKAKRSPGQNISWCQAFGIAFWSGIYGPKKKTNNPPVHIPGNNNSPNQGEDINNNSPAAPHNEGVTADTDKADNTTSLHTTYNRKSPDIEEEKTEIQAPQDNDDWNDNAFESN